MTGSGWDKSSRVMIAVTNQSSSWQKLLRMMLPLLLMLRPALSESELVAKCSWQIVWSDVCPSRALDGQPKCRGIPSLEWWLLTYFHFDRSSNKYPSIHAVRSRTNNDLPVYITNCILEMGDVNRGLDNSTRARTPNGSRCRLHSIAAFVIRATRAMCTFVPGPLSFQQKPNTHLL